MELRQRASQPPQWDFSRYFGGRSPVVRSKNLRLLLYARAFMWFHKIADFRIAEMHLLYKKQPGKVLRAQHRTIIAALVDEGCEIVRRIHASGGLIKPANGFSLQDIQVLSVVCQIYMLLCRPAHLRLSQSQLVYRHIQPGFLLKK